MYLRLFTLFLLLSIAFSATAQSWTLEQSDDNIKVFTQKVEGQKIKDLKIECTIRASLNSIIAILDDIEAHPVWVYRCRNSRFVEYIDAKEFYYYIDVDFPYPARDRDMVIYYKREQDPETKIIKTFSTSAPEKADKVDGLVRVIDFESTYTLVPHEDGSVDVTYYLRSDPAGAIPSWMINMAITKGPMKTMKSLFTEITKPKYQNAVMEGIEELR